MHPLIDFGPFPTLYSLVAAVACALSLPLALYEARYRRVSPRLVLAVWPAMLLGGFLGAHFYFILTHPYFMAADPVPKVFNVFAGISIQGMIIGGTAALYLMLRLAGEPLLPVLDVFVPVVAFCQSLGRLGCLATGCCYGKPTSLPLGIIFSDPFSPAPKGIPLHPTQVYESVLCAVLAAVLHHRLKKEGEPGGRVFAAYVLGYSVIRFSVQLFRDDDAGHLVLGMAHSQYTAVLMAAAAVWLFRRLGARRS
ncbi:MAG: prolipoprotein diacylglyceryl transferase [Elusimicrobia bacterium]|nr:prolipoprotein diacylglyceryl transferase [Elusimicrobiota bacterium]